MAKPNNILVIGATGQQGEALMDVLLERNLNIRAGTRDPSKGEARSFANQGVDVVQLDMDDPASVKEAAKGIDLAFFLTTPYESGPEAETQEGVRTVDALKAADVDHIVYSSVANADTDTGVPIFDSKRPVERRLEESGVPYTIVAPVFFRENLLMPGSRENLEQGKLMLPLPGDRPLQNISLAEVGRYHALVIENPDRFKNQRIDIASDENTPEEMAEAISQATGNKVTFQEVDQEQVEEPQRAMFQWFDRVGYSVDIGQLTSELPEVERQTFDAWAQKTDLTLVASKTSRSA